MTTYGSTGSDSLMKQARKAHTVLDVDASRAVHLAKAGHASEAHLDNGGHIKSAVFGGLDGIITTFATVTSVAGSGLPHAVILILGLAHLWFLSGMYMAINGTVAAGMGWVIGYLLALTGIQDVALG
ncbi:hypothetical protein SDRG_04734 [Saprolegnia diclina VS20]|uniref:Uncharacterized protein n=1 Tax=Saprolegnia diclina (strain VS20) TaxID=1156394 RepID=T0QSL6_SAPDV|nr:hypothetical protein SDRG_04734 [Saprolegnia diclina VS20]EQC37706.1 hypothetical protein SDRG_04734 [Saprolegnia diclina VS20]|eukprot:XP_008608639.1 hypothetical protein SDRG_04734 [Saprolegnia diclina VS20]